MIHGGHEFSGGIAWQFGIGIESNHVPDITQTFHIADGKRKAVFHAAAQECVEIRQFAALTLVTHPGVFLRIPAPRTVQQQEIAVLILKVLFVQFLDVVLDMLQQAVVVRHGFGFCIGEIGQQAKAQIDVAIGQVAHFERFTQVIDILFVE